MKYRITVLILASLYISDALMAQNINSEFKSIKFKSPQSICILEPSYEYANYFQMAPQRYKSAPTAAFEVDYINNWDPDARAAFEYAMDVWSSFIQSDVPIRIQANWLQMESENTLASAGPTFIYQIDAGEPDTWYSIALASALTGIDLVELNDQTDYDIIVNVNARFTNWHYDPTTPPSGNKFDFVTVIMHEIGHGLGFSGSMRTTSTMAEWGYDGDPIIYDKFIVDGDMKLLTDPGNYFNPSSALYNAVTGRNNGLFFLGDASSLNNKGVPASIYAPSIWNQGSSFSHVDQVTYSNTENALMRPQVDYNYAIHTPGTLVCGMFYDMGWPLGPGCSELISVEPEQAEIALNLNEMDLGITNAKKRTTLNIQIRNEHDTDQLLGRAQIVSGNAFSLPGNVQFFNLNPSQNKQVTVSYTPQSEGVHTDVLQIFHNDPSQPNPIEIPIKGEALRENEIVVLEQNYPNPFTISTNISFAIPQTSKVQLKIFDVLGKHVMTLVDGEVAPGRYIELLPGNNLASGTYYYIINVDGVRKSGKLFVVK